MRGLKFKAIIEEIEAEGRIAHAVRGLKLVQRQKNRCLNTSHRSRGAWIEMIPKEGACI